jgi:hypothetical protein
MNEGAETETCLQLRRIELDLKSASPQKALFHEHNSVPQTPELGADGQESTVRTDCCMDNVYDVTQLPVTVLRFDCDKKRGA